MANLAAQEITSPRRPPRSTTTRIQDPFLLDSLCRPLRFNERAPPPLTIATRPHFGPHTLNLIFTALPCHLCTRPRRRCRASTRITATCTPNLSNSSSLTNRTLMTLVPPSTTPNYNPLVLPRPHLPSPTRRVPPSPNYPITLPPPPLRPSLDLHPFNLPHFDPARPSRYLVTLLRNWSAATCLATTRLA